MTSLAAAPIPGRSAVDPADRAHDRRQSRTALIALAAGSAALLGLTGWLVFGGATSEDFDVATSVAAPAIDLIAAFLLGRAALGADTRRSAAGWTLIALAMVAYALADVLWSWIALVQGNDPFPSVADFGYLAFYPLVAAGLLLFPAASLARREGIRLGIDSAIVVLGGGIVVWHSLMRPALLAAEPDPVRELLTLGYPVGDLVVLFAIATISLRPPAWLHPRAAAALVVGLALMFVADVAWGELELLDVDLEPWVDVLYLASTLAIGFAGYVQAGSVHTGTDRELSGGLSRWLLFLPYVGVAAGFGVLFATASSEPGGETIDLVVGAIGLTILVLLRQEFISRENARLLADHARRAAEARFRSLEQQGSEALILVGIDGVVTYASSSLERVLDVDSRVLIGSPLTRIAHADDVERVSGLLSAAAAGLPTAALEWRLWTRSGTWRQVETIPANLLDDPSVGKIVLTTRDVRERKALRQQAAQASLRDLATGLPNRILFRDRLAQAIRACQRDGGSTAILLLDIDGFKRVNGTFGTSVGDRLLQEAARRLAAALGSTNTIARLGGDEFAVLFENATSFDVPRQTDLIRAALLEGAPIDGTAFPLTAAIGIAVADGSLAVDASALMRNADIAMNVAKGRGPDQVVIFEPSMQRDLESRFYLENDLRHALERDEFVLQYQPIVDLASGELVAAEALIRWHHPTLGVLGPNVFIPIAEETGLISPIGSWVLRTACAEVAVWARMAPGRVPRMSVNLAAPQIADSQLAWAVQSALAEASASPGWLTLEVTESMLIHDAVGAIERLHAVRALGVEVSVDDFGTGYSSLSYLQQFPINHIKIDRSFVAPLDEPGGVPGLAAAIVEIARALGMTTVAEGIETERQRNQLRAMGATYGQGFLFAKPLDASAIRLIVQGGKGILAA